MLLPFGEHILRLLPDPFDFEKIGDVAANIIAERTKENGNNKKGVSEGPKRNNIFLIKGNLNLELGLVLIL